MENKKNKKPLEKMRKTRLATSPLLLLRKNFYENLKDETVELTANQVKDKCFEALGLMEEYYREPANEADIKRTASGFEMEGIDGLDDYLKLLDNKDAPETSQEEPSTTPEEGNHHKLVAQHRDLIKTRIQKLLAMPQVRNLLKIELVKELKKFKNAQSKLQRLQRIKHAIEHATLDMHGTYLESKRKNHGVLVASASKKIEKLSGIVGKAEKEKKETIAGADSAERGFIATQELLEYKKQMKEKGFALTPSRRALLQKIVEHSMAGQKVFLVGSTGTGKTELAFYAVNEVTGEYEIIPWHEGTVVKDIMGQMQLAQNAAGQVESSFKPGPLVRGYTKGRGVIHEEITAGSTRTMMGMKPYLNLRPGQAFKIPEMNGTVLQVNEEILMEIFTGNPKSEQTQEREDLDPAILRMMKGIQVEYMPANELAKIVIAQLMDESGVLKLSKSDVQLIEKLADAANLMQMCHKNALDGEAAQAIKTATGIDDLRITKNFLDPGTFFGLFAKFDYERSKGKSLREYLREELDEFLHDPKNINAPEERKLALAILQLKGVLKEGSTLEDVEIVPKSDNKEKAYILPSEMGFLLGVTPKQENDPYTGEANADDADIQATVDDLINMLGDPTNLSDANKLIDKLTLDPQSKEKLKEMLAGYDEAAATAKELDPAVEVKPFRDV
ncbi:AAA family ATPase, partial [Candidatus Peregrinibacteria bacterium]|nr:AAA family ATPase [Candidatus Peregrinibacteria bacterium]